MSDTDELPESTAGGAELGNLMFGTSRGEFGPIPREWCEDFMVLTGEMDRRGLLESPEYVFPPFSNDTFETRPYQWSCDGCDDPACICAQPNFKHKASGLEIRWYKYPFRDSYSSTPLTRDVFLRVIAECVASLGRAP